MEKKKSYTELVADISQTRILVPRLSSLKLTKLDTITFGSHAERKIYPVYYFLNIIQTIYLEEKTTSSLRTCT